MKLSVNRLEDMLLSQGTISKEQHSKIHPHKQVIHMFKKNNLSRSHNILTHLMLKQRPHIRLQVSL